LVLPSIFASPFRNRIARLPSAALKSPVTAKGSALGPGAEADDCERRLARIVG